MSPETDQRKFERIHVQNKVRILRNGRVVAYALALNLSLGGVLLSAQPTLQPGTTCEIQILHSGSGGALSVPGTVLRSTDQGAAIQFATTLAEASIRTVLEATPVSAGLLESYRNYYRVSWSQDLTQCESLLGVTKAQYRKVFYATFSASLVASILPVWVLRASIPPYPNAVKVVLAFLYAGLWFLVLQPGMDLAVFRALRARTSRS